MRSFFLHLLLILSSLPNVISAENKQCRVIDDLLKETGYSYNGNCVNGLADGNGAVSGTSIDNQPYSYKGQFKKGYIEGKGFSVYLGDIYTGNFKKGKLDGSCQMIFADGSTYGGYCSMNRPHGHGDLRLKTGSIEMYLGDFVHGKKSGKGKTVFRDGSYYEGDYTNDLPEGYGKYTFSHSGIIYTGQFHKGLRHGSGMESHPIGVTYQGQFKNDLRHGKGVMIISGKKYSGVWENDKAVSGDIMKLSKPSPPANSAPIRSSHQGTEVSKCYAIAWDHPDNGGLGLHRGGAIELCRGTQNAIETTECFRHAWDHPNNGGLGLHRGGAIDLCKASQF